MPSRIEFTPNLRWLADKTKLVKRVAEILPVTVPTPNQMFDEFDKGRWIVGTSNDWRMMIRKDGICELSYRYSVTEERMEALKKVLEWFLE